MRVNRYVLDANIWISYFISGRMHVIVDIVKKYEIDIFSCDELLKEFRQVSQYPHLKKYNINTKEALKIIRELTIDFLLAYPLKNYIPTDKKDNYVIALALQTNSGFVTIADKDILNAKETLEKKFIRLKIISKAEFEKKFPLE